MTRKTVWVSCALNDTSLVKMFTSSLFDSNSMRLVDAIQANYRGEPQSRDHFPESFRLTYPDKSYKSLPEFFCAGGYWVISSEMISVLKEFELGQTSFYKTKLLKNDGVTLLDDRYSCISFGETKSAFEPKESQRNELFQPGLWIIPLALKHKEIAIKESALVGVDFWIDSKLRKSLFFSAALAEALKAAKLSSRLRLKECEIV